MPAFKKIMTIDPCISALSSLNTTCWYIRVIMRLATLDPQSFEFDYAPFSVNLLHPEMMSSPLYNYAAASILSFRNSFIVAVEEQLKTSQQEPSTLK